jgi:hypothetical protein
MMGLSATKVRPKPLPVLFLHIRLSPNHLSNGFSAENKCVLSWGWGVQNSSPTWGRRCPKSCPGLCCLMRDLSIIQNFPDSSTDWNITKQRASSHLSGMWQSKWKKEYASLIFPHWDLQSVNWLIDHWCESANAIGAIGFW